MRILTYKSTLLIASGVLWACSGDESSGASGTGGQAGASGSAGAGASAGTGGGASGSGGSAVGGSAGVGVGGSAGGSAGSGGVGGGSGSPGGGGTAGADGGAGSGGAAGSAGAGGSAGGNGGSGGTGGFGGFGFGGTGGSSCVPGDKILGPLSPASGYASVAAGEAKWNSLSPSGAVQSADGVNLNANFNTTIDQHTGTVGADAFFPGVPLTATITGIQVEVLRRSSVSAAVLDWAITLRKADKTTSVAKQSAVYWPTTFSYGAYGGPGDLWGLALTPADVNSNFFAVQVQGVNKKVPVSAYVDHIRLTIYFYENC